MVSGGSRGFGGGVHSSQLKLAGGTSHTSRAVASVSAPVSRRRAMQSADPAIAAM